MLYWLKTWNRTKVPVPAQVQVNQPKNQKPWISAIWSNERSQSHPPKPKAMPMHLQQRNQHFRLNSLKLFVCLTVYFILDKNSCSSFKLLDYYLVIIWKTEEKLILKHVKKNDEWKKRNGISTQTIFCKDWKESFLCVHPNVWFENIIFDIWMKGNTPNVRHYIAYKHIHIVSNVPFITVQLIKLSSLKSE